MEVIIKVEVESKEQADALIKEFNEHFGVVDGKIPCLKEY